MEAFDSYYNANGRVAPVAPYGGDYAGSPLAACVLPPSLPKPRRSHPRNRDPSNVAIRARARHLPPTPPSHPYPPLMVHDGPVQQAYDSGGVWNDIEHDDDSESDFSSIQGLGDEEERAESPSPAPESNPMPGDPAEQLSKPYPFNATVFDIDRSYFIGDTDGGGDIVAQLITTHQETEPKNAGLGLFRWIAIFQALTPSFDGDYAVATAKTLLQRFLRTDMYDSTMRIANKLYDYQEYASRAPNLNDVRRADVITHLRQVRQKYEHQIAASRITKGKCLDPNFSPYSDKAPQSSQLYFFAMPYFSLDSLAAHVFSNTSDTHPVRTLIQLQSPSTSTKRDKEQVVRQLGYSKGDQCFHVPQIWCLIVDNALLLTCGPFSTGNPRLDTIRTSPEPSTQAHTLQLSDGRGRIWYLPLSSCESWLEFQATLSSLVPDTLHDFLNAHTVLFRATAVTHSNWQDVFALAQRERVDLTIRERRFRTRRAEESLLSTTAAKRTESYRKDENAMTYAKLDTLRAGEASHTDAIEQVDQANEDTVSVPAKKFHLLYWLAGVPCHSKTKSNPNGRKFANQNKLTFDIELQSTTKLLAGMENGMTARARRFRHASEAPTRSTLKDVEAKFEGLKASVAKSGQPVKRSEEHNIGSAINNRTEAFEPKPSARQSKESNYLRCERIFEMAKVFFEFLLPLDHTSEMASVYWGNIYKYMDNPEADGTVDLGFRFTVTDGLDLRDIMLMLARDFEHGPEPGSVVLPKDFRKAALQLLRFSALGTGAQCMHRVRGEFLRSTDLLRACQEELLRCLRPKDGLIREAVLPGGIISLLTHQLARDITEGAPDIQSTYFDYALRSN
ncbi:MAG: hypothetical protein Q9225_005628 [Loekoesia sp. 1 TL-2023]